jgi:hypothetical protein
MVRVMTTRLVTAALAGVVLAGCLAACDGSPKPKASSYTVQSVKAGFITTGDLGAGTIQVDDSDHTGAHIIYTPPDSVPTCPYVQRADDVTGNVPPAVELPGSNSTGRFVVGPRDPAKTPLATVTQGALVFKTSALADNGMNQVDTETAKCPSAFTILGGPPVIIGNYTINSRPFELNGWRGFAQQLVHTFPADVDPETYDDLVTVVVHRANAILYIGYAQTKKVGDRADSAPKVRAALDHTLKRLG